MGTIDEQTLSCKVCNEDFALFYRTMYSVFNLHTSCNKMLIIQGPPDAL